MVGVVVVQLRAPFHGWFNAVGVSLRLLLPLLLFFKQLLKGEMPMWLLWHCSFCLLIIITFLISGFSVPLPLFTYKSNYYH